MRKDPDSDFSFDIKKVFRVDRIDDQNTMELMVIVWARSGKPVLEKRRVWQGKGGMRRLRKLVGMNIEDVQFIVNNSEKIIESMHS
jgi:hypothetical protein